MRPGDVSAILPADADAGSLEVTHLIETGTGGEPTVEAVVVANDSDGTDYTEEQFNALVESEELPDYNPDGIHIGGRTFFEVAVALCDSYGVSGMAGLDLALGVNSLIRVSSTTWNFKVQKTLNNAAMTDGEFRFLLHTDHVDENTIWYDIYDGEEWLYTSNESVVEVYTYEIRIIKYDASILEGDDYEGFGLAGATLGVYYDADCADPVIRSGDPDPQPGPGPVMDNPDPGSLVPTAKTSDPGLQTLPLAGCCAAAVLVAAALVNRRRRAD